MLARHRCFAALLLLPFSSDCGAAAPAPSACAIEEGPWRCLADGRGQRTGWKARRRIQTCDQQVIASHDFYEQDLSTCPAAAVHWRKGPSRDGCVHGD